MCRTSLNSLGFVLLAATLLFALDPNTADAQMVRSGTVIYQTIGGGRALPPTDRYLGPSITFAPRYTARTSTRYSAPQSWYVDRSGPYTLLRPSRTLYETSNRRSSNSIGRYRMMRFGRRSR